MPKPEKLSSRDHILNSSEKLFAKNGFHGTSVRDITDDAGVRLASVNYYFKTKDNLFSEVLARRANELISERSARLKALEFEGLNQEQSVEELIKTTVEPLFERASSGDKGWQYYLSLLATELTSSLVRIDEHDQVQDLQQNSGNFIKTLHELSDHTSDQKAHHAYQFIMGATFFLLTDNGRLDQLSNNKYKSNDFDAIYPDFLRFLTKGTLALLTKEP